MAVLKGLKRRLILIAVLGCAIGIYFIFTNKFSDSPSTITGDSFLHKVMLMSGGRERYSRINRLTFKKQFSLFTENGRTEISRKEIHSYDYSLGTKRLIQWRNDSLVYNLVQNDTTIFQTKNGIVDTTISKNQLKNKLQAATFVIGLPYTLESPNAIKTYNGIISFEGSKAHELEVVFKNSTDIWKMYYAIDTLEWLGYWVHTSDHYSLVINEKMIAVNGLIFCSSRTSYRTDSLRNRLFKRANYTYSNFKID